MSGSSFLFTADNAAAIVAASHARTTREGDADIAAPFDLRGGGIIHDLPI